MQTLFSQVEDAVTCLQVDLNVSFEAALTETFDNLEHDQIRVEAGAPTQEQVQTLIKKYRTLHYETISYHDRAQLFSLLTLKAMVESKRPSNQMPTPPIIATVIALLAQRLLPNRSLKVIDPAIGTGQLLANVIAELQQVHHSQNIFQLAGIDNDETLLDNADLTFHLHQFKIDLFCQDALQPWLIKQPDVVISDLPVGFYPDDENAEHFEQHRLRGHSYAHLLFIEQIIENLRPNGFAFLVVPTALFELDEGNNFMSWLTKKVNLRAIIQLPSDMFHKKADQKRILVFQNHGDASNNNDVLIAKLDSFKRKQSLVEFNVKLNDWYGKTTK